MEVVVHVKKSVSTKVSKEIAPFQQEFPLLVCDVKTMQLDIWSRTKNPTPSVVRNPTLTPTPTPPTTSGSATLVPAVE